ncbi:MAG: NAD-dependent epimerase/dehydratase family protein [bacterium]
MRTALVTGATGLVGTHVVHRLLRDGWQVRALVRDVEGAGDLLRAGARLAPGNVLDGRSLSAAADGCDVMIHAAAAVTPRGGWEAFRQPNVDGTRNAIAAARACGARLVHVSSVAVYGGASHGGAGLRTSEEVELPPLPDAAFYARSKRESEQLVLEAHHRGEVWATAVRPDVIYGRYDRQFVPRIARLLRWGFSPLIGGGRTTLPIVHAENVADGVVRAMATDAAGGRAYNLANDYDVSVADFFRLAGEGMQMRLRPAHIPLGLATGAMRAFKTVAPLFFGGAFNAVSSASVNFLTRDNPYTSERARRELGWNPPVQPEVGVPDAFHWWTTHR